MADWRGCVDWLVSCRSLPKENKLTGREWRTEDPGDIMDIANQLRDGVILCHLLNRLHPTALDPRQFSQRPQSSQYLCKKNIQMFLNTCRDVFGIKNAELFDVQDLFDKQDLMKVLHTLSALSQSEKAKNSGYIPFQLKLGRQNSAYGQLNNYARQEEYDDDNDYYIEDPVYNEQEEDIYGCLMDFTLLPSRKSQAVPKSHRDLVIEELITTEKKYIDVLRNLNEEFRKPLQRTFLPKDFDTIFFCIPELYEIHQAFYSDLELSQDVESSKSLSDCFITFKEKFLLYGHYCSNLPTAQERIDTICTNSPPIRQTIEDCQKKANDGRFKLRDLLTVPMQRVLKYHLLVKELIKNTDELNAEKKMLVRALDEMQDLSLYINEVKRDHESLNNIQNIEKNIAGFTDLLPQNTHLMDYGRLMKDGELKVKTKESTRSLYIFLFDKLILFCKSKNNESYEYHEFLILSNYRIDDNNPKDKYSFSLVDKKEEKSSYSFKAKTVDEKDKWVQAINMAKDNFCPQNAISAQHHFKMATFSQPTICDVCRKLLRGVFFQGYQCQNTKLAVHKECIGKANLVVGPPRVPPKRPSIGARPAIGLVKAVLDYAGHPAPDFGRSILRFKNGETFELLQDLDGDWCEGRISNSDGFFPKSYVTVTKYYSSQSNTPTPTSPISTLPHGGSRYRLTSITENALLAQVEKLDYPANVNLKRRSTDPQMVTTPPPPSPRNHSFRTPSKEYVNADSFSAEFSEENNNNFLWYAGTMTRDEATAKLKPLPNGTFLIRRRAGSDEYALSVMFDSPKHIKIEFLENRFYLEKGFYFANLPDLVKFYGENSLGPAFSELPTKLSTPFKYAEEQKQVGIGRPDILGICRALYDYSPMEPNHIAIAVGDEIMILNKAGESQGWWKGKLRGKVGYFPCNYVVEV